MKKMVFFFIIGLTLLVSGCASNNIKTKEAETSTPVVVAKVYVYHVFYDANKPLAMLKRHNQINRRPQINRGQNRHMNKRFDKNMPKVNVKYVLPPPSKDDKIPMPNIQIEKW